MALAAGFGKGDRVACDGGVLATVLGPPARKACQGVSVALRYDDGRVADVRVATLQQLPSEFTDHLPPVADVRSERYHWMDCGAQRAAPREQMPSESADLLPPEPQQRLPAPIGELIDSSAELEAVEVEVDTVVEQMQTGVIERGPAMARLAQAEAAAQTLESHLDEVHLGETTGAVLEEAKEMKREQLQRLGQLFALFDQIFESKLSLPLAGSRGAPSAPKPQESLTQRDVGREELTTPAGSSVAPAEGLSKGDRVVCDGGAHLATVLGPPARKACKGVSVAVRYDDGRVADVRIATLQLQLP